MMGDGNGLSDDVKKGILVIEVGYQAEKWLDNEEHAAASGTTRNGDGWSGWKEHTTASGQAA